MASNNFFLNNDPLLFHSNNRQFDDNPYNEIINQYKMMQQQPQVVHNQYDYLGELDRLIKTSNPNAIALLNDNDEYNKLSNDLSSLIQNEIMSSIKWKINDNQEAIKNIRRQTEIINEASKKLEDEQRQNLSELNDYVKNYSNITFEEYKKIKNEANKK